MIHRPLGFSKTVQEVWDECIEKFPDSAPGQEEAIRLLSQLYNANLHYQLLTVPNYSGVQNPATARAQRKTSEYQVFIQFRCSIRMTFLKGPCLWSAVPSIALVQLHGWPSSFRAQARHRQISLATQ